VKCIIIIRGQASGCCSYSQRGDRIAINADPPTGIIMRGDA